MNKKLIANWKQNLNEEEVKNWFNEFYSLPNLNIEEVELIIAPSFPFLPLAKKFADIQNIKIASQNLSSYENGPHTGMVGLQQIKKYINFAIIGHSEVRNEGEDDTVISNKIQKLQMEGVIPIVCFSDIPEYLRAKRSEIPNNSIFYAYEPMNSIGTGNPASLSSIQSLAKEIGLNSLIYGGSVNGDNILQYLSTPLIEGFLVGGASLDPYVFHQMAQIISKYK